MQVETKGIVYEKIYDLPLNKFIDCIVDNNLSSLTISGYPTQEQLITAWDNILAEYSELIGTDEYRMYVQLYKEVNIIKITLNQITIAINILRVVRDNYFVIELNKLLGTDCKFNWNDQASYQAECTKCMNRSAALKIKLDLKNMQFEAIEKKNSSGTGGKLERQYFTSILITLSDHVKYRIEETIKMSEYCDRVKRFSDYCEQIKKKT